MSGEREEELEPTLDVEVSPMMEPHAELICDVPTVGASTDYWQAQKFASTLHMEFEELQKVNDISGMRQRFYVLARYYGRTVKILRSALSKGKEALVNAALTLLHVSPLDSWGLFYPEESSQLDLQLVYPVSPLQV